MGRIHIDHTHPAYVAARDHLRECDRWNGAYYYSKEIVRGIVPNVETDRPWVTVNVFGKCDDRAIVFIHNNWHPKIYEWLKAYDDLVLVCSRRSTMRLYEYIGRTVFLPLSIDVAEVQSHMRPKDRGTCAVGRMERIGGHDFPPGTDIITDMPREKLLDELARYKYAYATDRCAIEAKALGCAVLPFDPEVNLADLHVYDTLDAARMLQAILDGIDD